MSRGITMDMQAFAEAISKRPILLVEIALKNGEFARVCSGIGTRIWDGKEFSGVGIFGGVEPPEETTDLKATGATYTLSGVPSALISAVANDMQQGLPAKAWLGGLTEDDEIIADPLTWDESTVAVPSTSDSADSCTIRVTTENLMATLRRPRTIRMTPEDQKTRDPSDTGFRYVASLQDRVIQLGRA
jgi:hypothetical protein